VKEKLVTGERHLLSVLEMRRKLGTWRAWLDNTAVSPPISLPGSHGRFDPQAIGESWNGGTRVCNRYGYRFASIQVARTPGGQWGPAKAGLVWRDRNNRALKTSYNSFIARSTLAHHAGSNVPDVPPLLPGLASRLTRTALTVECTRLAGPTHVRAPTHLLLSKTVCERLLGYAVAQPWVPAATRRLGFALAATALGFLRGVAATANVPQSQVDCRAVGWFYRAMRVLGATRGEALSLRHNLLLHRTELQRPLAFRRGCRFS
jgi:hypothetical protein